MLLGDMKEEGGP